MKCWDEPEGVAMTKKLEASLMKLLYTYIRDGG